ncbi:MAG TPA: hypothetical protein VIW29_11800 [Polyangiaceae bacterium]
MSAGLSHPALWPLLALWSLLACAKQPARGANDALTGQPETFVARVARLRELSELRPTPIVFDDEAEFQRVANQKAEREAIAPTPMDQTAVQLSLGLLFAAEGAAPARSFGSLHRSQMVAFYDEFLHQVHIRQSSRKDEDLPFVVAHELGHSLQFQHFRIPDIASVTDEDARLARLALLEGDAMLVMTAMAAETNHLPLSRVLVRLAQGALEASLQGYRAALEQSPELRSAPPFQRERLVFPYQAGGSFVAQVHRAGGFALVNRLYEVPPATTEQILHPERYLAGELAVPVRAPRTPAGWRWVQSGHVGELLVRAMLDVCNERPASHLAAAGWGGDAFTVVRRGDQGGLLFVSSWDSPQDTDEFERSMRRTAACWDRAPAATRAIFRGQTQVRRQGQVVAVARGFPSQQARQLLAQLPELVGPRIASRAPFGPVVIPPVKRAAVVSAPFVRGKRLIAPRLGLSIPLLPGLKPKVEGDDVSFNAEGEGFASLILAISELSFSSESVRHSFDTFEQALRKPLAADQTVSVVVKAGSVETPVGKAVEREWRVDDTPVRGRLLLVPICGGTGMLVIGQGYASAQTRRQLDQIVAGLVMLEAGSPICAELDP